MPNFGRPEERDRFETLINELWKHNQDAFENKERIVDLFIKAQTTGKLLEIAWLIEKT